ncbi:MAG: VWA domain-containing protein [Alphaproteobacteria bacterium]|nr:VWA domain-containing protein [Alphaproteobacteria bacterium]
MSIIRPLRTAATTAALILGLSIFALALGLFLAGFSKVQAAEVQVTAGLGQSVIPTDGGKVYLRLSLKALAHQVSENRAPLNVGLVLDRSGSMKGTRIEAAKEAARMALSRLGRDDLVALVAYNHNVDVLQSARRLTSHDSFTAAIDRLQADGRTALFAGVTEGGRQVEKNYRDRQINRVILMSDGLANVGPSTPAELAKLGQELGGKGISVTTIGLGLGYNEDLMQRLALASDGNHAFAETPEDLIKIFNSEFGDALSIAAQDIEITVEVRAGFKPVRVLGREAEIDGSHIKVKLNQLTALNERYLIVELDASKSAAIDEVDVASVETDYLDLQVGERRKLKARVSAAVSDDKKRQSASRDNEIMSEITTQIATERSEKAVVLRDKGDLDGARQLLQENAAILSKSRASFAAGEAPASPQALQELEKLEEDSKLAADNLDPEQWAKTRKAMRYQQHKAKQRQSY